MGNGYIMGNLEINVQYLTARYFPSSGAFETSIYWTTGVGPDTTFELTCRSRGEVAFESVSGISPEERITESKGPETLSFGDPSFCIPRATPFPASVLVAKPTCSLGGWLIDMAPPEGLPPAGAWTFPVCLAKDHVGGEPVCTVPIGTALPHI